MLFMLFGILTLFKLFTLFILFAILIFEGTFDGNLFGVVEECVCVYIRYGLFYICIVL